MSDHAFHLLEESGSWELAEWWPHAVGLAVAAFCTTALCAEVPPATLTSRELWILACRYTLPVFFCTAVSVCLAGRLVAGRGPQDAWDAALGTACQASWCPALVLFFRHNSPWAAVLAAGLAIAGTRALLLRLERDTEAVSSALHAMAVATALQLGVVAMCVANWRWAALLLSAAAVLLSWMLSSANLWPLGPAMRARRIRLVPVFLLGTLFSAGGLTPYLRHGAGTGGIEGFLRALFGETGSAARHADAGEGDAGKTGAFPGIPDPWRFAERADQSVAIDESYPGVILWPEVEPYTILMPPLPSPRQPLTRGAETDTAGIPFSGFYSFQRAIFPTPKRWHQMHGDPTALTFRTTDRSRLVMEAHQDFGRPIDLGCCRQIRLTLRLKDVRPEAVKVALDLIDRTARRSFPERLPPERLAETLVFPMPQAPVLRQFDHITLRFHLTGPRWDRSAGIAIRRFHFVP